MTGRFARMAAALEIVKNTAMEGYWYLVSHHPDVLKEPGFNYPWDWVGVRDDALKTAQRLAYVESVVGSQAVSEWLDNIERRARALESDRENAA